METNSATVKLLSEIGFMAAARCRVQDATTIFEGLQAARPDSEYPAIGLAVAQLSGKNYDQAIKLLRENALAKNPDSADAKSFLGLALKMAGRTSESDTVLKEAATSGKGPAQAMAEALLKG